MNQDHLGAMVTLAYKACRSVSPTVQLNPYEFNIHLISEYELTHDEGLNPPVKGLNSFVVRVVDRVKTVSLVHLDTKA